MQDLKDKNGREVKAGDLLETETVGGLKMKAKVVIEDDLIGVKLAGHFYPIFDASRSQVIGK